MDRLSLTSYSSAEDGYDSDEPPQLDLDLEKLKTFATKALGVDCTSVERLTRGSWHEIFVLRFRKPDSPTTATPQSLIRADFSCIACFSRVKTSSEKDASEVATIKYLRQHTKLPIPEIYAQDLDRNNEVGAAFVLMERLPGRHLYKTWDNLSLEHKKSVLSQIAAVIVELSSLRFDKIGCLTSGGIGPIINLAFKQPEGPFDNTIDYLQAFACPDSVSLPELKEQFPEVRKELAKCISAGIPAVFGPPFSLIHADFDAQNMLFSDSPDGSAPKFTGLIDFEYAYTGPLYFLYDYPIFIQDVDWSKHLYEENAILRPYFVRSIFEKLPEEDSQTFIDCINSKNYVLNRFHEVFVKMHCSEHLQCTTAEGYLEEIKEGTGPAYSGRIDYKPEYYNSDGELVSSEEEENKGKKKKQSQKVPKKGARRQAAEYCEKARRRMTSGCNFL